MREIPRPASKIKKPESKWSKVPKKFWAAISTIAFLFGIYQLRPRFSLSLGERLDNGNLYSQMMALKNDGSISATNVIVSCKINTAFSGATRPQNDNQFSGETEPTELAKEIPGGGVKTVPCYHMLQMPGYNFGNSTLEIDVDYSISKTGIRRHQKLEKSMNAFTDKGHWKD